jgi:PKD repeat protein
LDYSDQKYTNPFKISISYFRSKLLNIFIRIKSERTMKKMLMLASLGFCLNVSAQTADTLIYERFETGGTTFTLNTPDMGGVSAAVGYNQWIVNNAYAGGNGSLVCLGFPFTFTVTPTPPQPALITGGTNTGYMHIVSDAAQASGIQNCCFLAADGICNFNEINFTRMTSDINTTGYDTVSLSFLWLCSGGTNIHGELYYSTNSGVSWTQVTTPITQYKNQGNWTTQTISMPAFAGQTTLRFGFRFVNQTSNAATDPGFGIDEFLITGKVSGPPLSAAFGVSDPDICPAGCIDFTDQSTGNPTSWLWIFQGASTAFSNQQNPQQICYNTPGTYSVTLIVGNGSTTDTLTLNSVVVHPNPVMPVVSLSNDTLFATSGYAGYQWFLDGNIIPGATDSFHVVINDGAYTVSVTDTNGCSALSAPLNYTTGLSEVTGSDVTVFPNPVSDYLLLEGVNHVTMWKIIDPLGRIIMQEFVDNNYLDKIDVRALNSGVYLLGIYESNRTIMKRFVHK